MKNERLSLLLDKIEDYDILCLQEVKMFFIKKNQYMN